MVTLMHNGIQPTSGMFSDICSLGGMGRGDVALVPFCRGGSSGELSSPDPAKTVVSSSDEEKLVWKGEEQKNVWLN